MKLWTSTDHPGHYPVGVASIILAETHSQACDLLQDALRSKGLPTLPFSLEEVDMEVLQAIILNDGDY